MSKLHQQLHLWQSFLCRGHFHGMLRGKRNIEQTELSLLCLGLLTRWACLLGVLLSSQFVAILKSSQTYLGKMSNLTNHRHDFCRFVACFLWEKRAPVGFPIILKHSTWKTCQVIRVWTRVIQFWGGSNLMQIQYKVIFEGFPRNK